MKQSYPMLDGKELFSDNREIYIKKSTSVPDYVDVMHTHNFIEINYILSGRCIHIENDHPIEAKAGNLFIINYMVPHKNKPFPNDKPYVSYNIGFTPGALDSSMKKEFDFLKLKSSFLLDTIFPNTPETPQSEIFSKNSFNELEPLFEDMLSEYTNGYKGAYDLLRAYLLELIIKVFRKLDTNTMTNPHKKQEYYINLAVQYMKQNYMHKLKVEDIAYRSFLSKSYFSQLFKDITGMCFSDYLQKIRMDEACRLLTTTDKIISDIGYEVGFNDMKSFYAIFHRHTGFTPKQYRQLFTKTGTPPPRITGGEQ